MIQVFVTRKRMKQGMDGTSASSVGLGTIFGFNFQFVQLCPPVRHAFTLCERCWSGAPLAFMPTSPNLVVELGIIIGLFLSWQFVVGDYIGGVLLILFMKIVVR